MPATIAVILLALFVAFIFWINYQMRLGRATEALRERLTAQDPQRIFFRYANDRISRIGGGESRWHSSMIACSPGRITVYRRSLTMNEVLSFAPSELRWFGRPEKYQNGTNEIWLHVERDTGWHLLKVKLSRGAMQDFVRSLKPLVSAEINTAYRRTRPYVHYGPLRALPAEQDIHGAWTLDAPITLYLMPLHVVILRDAEVLRVLPLERIQQVAALRRIDQPSADGLASFNLDGEKFAFASKDYQALAEAIAEAARRSLEAPLLQKQKGKDDDEDD